MFKWLRSALFGAEIASFSADTFVVWEPCTHSHAEVVPGYVKYLLDLGFKVAVFVTPKRYAEGLFCRFDDPRIALHQRSQRAIRLLFRFGGIGKARGILITTARKISGRPDYSREHRLFAQRNVDQRLLIVEHDVKPAADCGALTPDIITLRAAHYGSAVTTVVNPHYFGEVAVTPKNLELIRFITIGALRGKRRNVQLLVAAASRLHETACSAFVITVIGRGNLRGVPHHLRRYFEIKGRVDFSTLYSELEQSDFFLPLLDPDNAKHERYITTGTSGSFQLIFGFAKPCLIAEKFASRNNFDANNSLLYANNEMLADAMKTAIEMTPACYAKMQSNLQVDAALLYQKSLENLGNLIAT